MVAERIKMLRENLNISQQELAKKLSVTRASVSAWEMGISTPSTVYLVELSRMFHVSTDYLLGLEKHLTVDVTGLTTEQIRILTDLAEHFRKEVQQKKYLGVLCISSFRFQEANFTYLELCWNDFVGADLFFNSVGKKLCCRDYVGFCCKYSVEKNYVGFCWHRKKKGLPAHLVCVGSPSQYILRGLL